MSKPFVSEFDFYLHILVFMVFYCFFSSVTGYIPSIDIATPSNIVCDFKIQTNSALPEKVTNILLSIFRPRFLSGDIVLYRCLKLRFFDSQMPGSKII